MTNEQLNKHLVAISKDVAVALWGEPNAKRSKGDKLRWGNKGSKSLDADKGPVERLRGPAWRRSTRACGKRTPNRYARGDPMVERQRAICRNLPPDAMWDVLRGDLLDLPDDAPQGQNVRATAQKPKNENKKSGTKVCPKAMGTIRADR